MTSKNNNLELWQAVEATDPDFTHEYKGKGGFQGSAINAVYLTKKATERWGPIGKGWGYEILEDRYDQGAPICFMLDKEGNKTDTLVYSVIHTVKLQLWYLDGDQVVTAPPHYGHTDYVYANKYGVQTESEAPKKSVTDALKKSLSMLGFSADIFMGLFDDQDYLAQNRTEHDIKKAESKEVEIEQKRKDLTEYIQNHIDTIKSGVTTHEVNAVAKSVCRHLNRQANIESLKDIAERGARAITEAATARKNELSEKEEANETV